MTSAFVNRWAAWSPGREDRDAWLDWARAPEPLGTEGPPGAAFLPAMFRRRCRPLARIMLTAAYEGCPEERRSEVRTVFASRHGNINDSIELLERLSERLPISPTKFSHTVHNAQAGLFSIAAGNRHASTSISAQEDTFACAFLEALTHLQREPGRPVLLVMADIPLDETFSSLVDEPAAAYGLALLLASDGDGPRIEFELGGEEVSGSSASWPDAIEFLRWLIGDEERLCLGQGRRRWSWQRAS